MARQRPGKTYLSAVQKAELEAKEKEEEENKGHHHYKDRTRPRRNRRPPPRFSDLFIKKKDDSSEQSKENISLFSCNTKSEELFNRLHARGASRKPLGINNNLSNSSTSIPSFSDTFDKLLSKPSYDIQPYIPASLGSSSRDTLTDISSGVLFKSFQPSVSTWITNMSTGWAKRPGRYNNQEQKDDKVKSEKECYESPKKKPHQPSKDQVYSPQLFTSLDMVADKDNKTPPISKLKPKPSLRQRKQAARKQRVTKTRKKISPAHTEKSKEDCFMDGQDREPLTVQPPLVTVQPSPLVQRFLQSQGIVSTPPASNITPGTSLMPPALHHSNSGTHPLSGKSSGKSSVHTSTPTERSKWSGQSSLSLNIKMSPVPREVEMVTDNSSIIQSVSPSAKGNRKQSCGKLGASPSLPSKYETCTSLVQLEDTDHHYITGETCDSKEGVNSPDMFKGADIPKRITFESPPEQDPPSYDTGLPPDNVLNSESSIIIGRRARVGKTVESTDLSIDHVLNSEPSIIIGRRTRAGKTVKRLQETSHTSSIEPSPRVFVTQRNRKALSHWPGKWFSPKLTRSRSRMLGQSDESQNTDVSSHFGNSSASSFASDKGHRKTKQRRNTGRKKSKSTAQKNASWDTDQSTTDIPSPPQPIRMLQRNRNHLQGMPPIARSVRLSRKSSTNALIPVRRSSRISSRHELTQTHTNKSDPPSPFHVPSDCSSIIKFRPRRERRNNQFIFYQRSPCLSSTVTSLESLMEDSHIAPPRPTTASHHTTGTSETRESIRETLGNPDERTRKESVGNDQCVSRKNSEEFAEFTLKDSVVMLTRLEETEMKQESVESDCVFALPTLPAKPGKGWRRSITMRARAASLTSTEDMKDMPAPLRIPTRASEPYKRTSGLRISSLPFELNNKHHYLRNTNCTDTSQRSVLQMSFCVEEEEELSAVQQPTLDPRHQVLELCSQEEPVPLTHCFTESRLACCRKIGEGVYGEVFMTQPNPTNLEGATVLKIMPIEGNFLVNGEPQKKFEEILSEMVISLELSGLRGPVRQESRTENFVHVKGSWCIEGRYPHDLLHLWDLYHEEKGSENDRPDIFPDTQLYIVLEFGHGGRDLEGFVFNNARDLMGIFLQIAYSLAVAEEALEFEHRDLHWGNVLVAPTTESKIDFTLGGQTYTLNTYGLKATVIDFTLSRMKLPHCIVFNNLAEDPSLFTSEGDYQFEIYRLMQQANNNTWESFKPYTNVLWLHYLLVKMTSQCYIKNKNTHVHRTHQSLLTKLRDSMLDYESAKQFVLLREAE